VQRLRVRYAKRGRARFASHRDFGRAFERALRRAGVPMAYSSGFSPHPRISFANAAPTGAASEAEYLEIALAERCDSERVREALDAALPPGLDVLTVVEASGPALADRLTGSVWVARIDGAEPAVLDRSIAALLAADTVSVDRMTKSGLRTFDVRGAVVSLEREDLTVRMVVRHGTPLVRPDDVVNAMRALEPALGLGGATVLTRTSQGRLDPATGEIADPLV
jgi:radical SAM-linked protein